jgi:hypothetical protein
MQDFDFLFVVAQVAVAFAGFASIVVAVLQSGSRENPLFWEVSGFDGLLDFSLAAVFFSLVPYVCTRLINASTACGSRATQNVVMVAGTTSGSRRLPH